MPKIIINNTLNLLLKLQSAFWQFQTVTVSECCLIKLLSYILFEKNIYVYILALEKASAGNRHCVNCIAAHFRSLFNERRFRVGLDLDSVQP